jgi:hypothetical protein
MLTRWSSNALSRLPTRRSAIVSGKRKFWSKQCCKEEQHREGNKAALVLPAQPPEEATMQVNQPNPHITTLLPDMMQGNTANKEREKIDPETRSPPLNKQKNNAPTLKPSVETTAAPEKSVCTKHNKHEYKYPHMVVGEFIKLSRMITPSKSLLLPSRIYFKNGQLVDPLFAISLIKTGGSEEKIHKWSGITINMMLLGAHFKISSYGHNPFEKQKVWGKGSNKNKEEF